MVTVLPTRRFSKIPLQFFGRLKNTARNAGREQAFICLQVASQTNFVCVSKDKAGSGMVIVFEEVTAIHIVVNLEMIVFISITLRHKRVFIFEIKPRKIVVKKVFHII